MAHRFSIADVEGDEVLLGVATGIQQKCFEDGIPGRTDTWLESPLLPSYEVRPFGSFF